MNLDIGTLSVVTVFVTALLGALLVFAGLQNRSIRSPMWWGAAQIVGAAGLALATSRGSVPDFVAVDIANALVLLGYGLTWAGARIFDGRKVQPLVVVFAPILWLLVCRIPAFADDINLRVVVLSAMLAMLAAATAEEFWRGRDEPLMSRWPTVIVLLAYAAALLARIPATYFSPLLDSNSLMSSVSFALIAFGTLLFTVVMAFLLLNMTKERTELQHKINSLVDPLSGVANRRAFLNGAARLFGQQALDREPLAVLLFDLDRFKADQRPHGSRGRRPGAADLRQGCDLDARSRTCCSAASAGRNSRRSCRSAISARRLPIADRVRRNFAAAAAAIYGRRSGADREHRRHPRRGRQVGRGHAARGGRPRALPRQGQRPKSGRGDGAARRGRGAVCPGALDRAAARSRARRHPVRGGGWHAPAGGALTAVRHGPAARSRGSR